MIKYCLPAALGLAVLTTALGVHHQTAQAAPKRKRAPRVAIGAAAFTPKKIAAQGGTVRINRVAVNARNGATIFAVRAYVELAGSPSPGTKSTLTGKLRNTYHGTVQVPGNTGSARTTARLYVEVDSSAGIVKKAVGRINIDAFKGDPNQPPPPPPI